MYAIVVDVELSADRAEEATKLLNEEVVPSVRQAPGVVAAYWLRSDEATAGRSFVIFESREAAERALAQNPPEAAPEAPVKLSGAQVMEVVAHI